MLAMLFATVAFSIDAMLPALPQIAADLSPDAVNSAQLVLSAFVLGMGTGSLFTGPLSDAFGRKPVIFTGFGLYAAGAVLAWAAPSLEMLMVARVVQGLGAAAPRIVGLALVRDLYAGREMARVSSFVMMVFILIPAIAPSIGALILGLAGWRGIFLAFVVFAGLCSLWIGIRQDETLPLGNRRPLSAGGLWRSLKEVLSDRIAMTATMTMTLGFGQMFALLSSAQQIFGETYGHTDDFPLWFALMALLAGAGSLLNSRLVLHVGMRPLATRAYLVQAAFSAVMAPLIWSESLSETSAFAAFFIWSVSIFFMAGLTFGNLQALALQKMGHIAGLAASVVTAVATVLSVAIAAPVGLAFDGTPVPVMVGAAVASSLAFGLMRSLHDHH
jgi:DHA1 family bicyclomycin/chloramphenicol resistance-like MFS transporter